MASLTHSLPEKKANSKLREWLYLDLALVGTVIPGWLFYQGIVAHGAGKLLPLAFANQIGTALTADLLISSLAFWILAAREMDRLGSGKGKLPLFMALNLLIGLSCSLPAFMWWRERQIARSQA